MDGHGRSGSDTARGWGSVARVGHAAALVALALLATTALGAGGCASEVTATVTMTPPAAAPPAANSPPPAPEGVAATPDGDGDGVAKDRCPNAAETVNGFEDDDGCPDEAPDFFLANDTLRFAGTFEFGLLGELKPESQAIVDGLAGLLAKHAELELVEVAVFVTGTGKDADDKSAQRAKKVVRALVAAGVDEERLRGRGYGGRCADGGPRVEVHVVRRAGADTGALACDR